MDAAGVCKWFAICPLRQFEKKGLLSFSWKTAYCESGWSDCVRYQMVQRGEDHPDWMLPDGSLNENLKL